MRVGIIYVLILLLSILGSSRSQSHLETNEIPIGSAQFTIPPKGCGLATWVFPGSFQPDGSSLVLAGKNEGSPSGTGVPLYICRAEVNGVTYIGKYFIEYPAGVSDRHCWVSDGLVEHVFSDPLTYEILLDQGHDLKWRVWKGRIPTSAFEAFPSGLGVGSMAYVGQCDLMDVVGVDSRVPGTLLFEDRQMYVPFGQQSPKCDPDFILTCKGQKG